MDENGRLVQTGWARRLLLKYNRNRVAAGRLRLKEWDCYCVMNPRYKLTLIVADVGYFGMATIDWIDFEEKRQWSGGSVRLFTRGKLDLPPTADEGDVFYERKDASVAFLRDPPADWAGESLKEGMRPGDLPAGPALPQRPERVLAFDFPKFKAGDARGIRGVVTLRQPPGMDTMVNVIPFENHRHFVYVQKVCCMPAVGVVEVGGETFQFAGEEDGSWGVLDWSRGVFPYRTRWWWSYCSGKVCGVPFGFNVDYGFGAESSKNMVFYDGKGHHLDEVTYEFDETDPMKPWTYTSNDGRFEATLDPVFYHETKVNALVLATAGVNAYGFVTGTVVLDDGTEVRVRPEDQLFASAEHYRHRW